MTWLHGLREGEETPRREVVPAQASLAVYSMPDEKTEIHIAGGDMTEFRNIDVLVNSENDYMQMARTFEGRRSVSSSLRHLGSCFDRANRLLEDTIQNELNLIVECDIGPRPLGLYTVVVTSAGHADSVPRRNRVRPGRWRQQAARTHQQRVRGAVHHPFVAPPGSRRQRAARRRVA